jgi:hypothetical protein
VVLEEVAERQRALLEQPRGMQMLEFVRVEGPRLQQ